jgi:hypothetical protein
VLAKRSPDYGTMFPNTQAFSRWSNMAKVVLDNPELHELMVKDDNSSYQSQWVLDKVFIPLFII